jgi:carboxymethylenebutenolidase
MAKITAPVYGFYGENDARVDATIPQATTDMKAAGKMYDPVTYAGAGHGFMRAGQAPPPDATATPQQTAAFAANKKAYEEGFARMVKELKANTSGTKKMARGTRPGKIVVAKAATMDCAAMHEGM